MSEAKREFWFSVPFFYFDIENSKELNRELVRDIYKWKEEDKEGVLRSNKHGWHSTIVMHYREEFDKIGNYNLTIDRCHNTVGIAILNTSITIVFGFSILVLSKFIPTIYFGIFTGLAMLLAMISVLTLLPSLILVFKPFGK